MTIEPEEPAPAAAPKRTPRAPKASSSAAAPRLTASPTANSEEFPGATVTAATPVVSGQAKPRAVAKKSPATTGAVKPAQAKPTASNSSTKAAGAVRAPGGGSTKRKPVPPALFSAAAVPAEAAVAAPAAVEPPVVEPALVEPAVIVPAPAVQPAKDEPTDAAPEMVAAPVMPPAARPATRRLETKVKPGQKGAPSPNLGEVVLSILGLSKHFGATLAVDRLDLEVRAGSFFGIVGPNGAGKTTTLSMVSGLLRPTEGTVTVHGIDVWREPVKAKRTIGVLPDALRLFDRLTGVQLLYYSGILRGLDAASVRIRSDDLIAAFGLEDAADRLVADYSAGMTKKIALAAAMIHSPRLLILDEPFESVDPVSAANLIEILQKYVASGGTVVLSSHGMDFIQRVCDHVAIIVEGKVLAAGTMAEVRGSMTLEEKFVELAGGRRAAEGMEWLHSFSDRVTKL